MPIARQIAGQLQALIRAGHLAPGDRLPPVRVLAGFLRVNRNTVAKVYAALEREGWVVTAPGRGTYVPPTPPSDGAAELVPLADRLLAEAAARGLSETAVADLVASRAAARWEQAGPRVGFVECNPSDLAYFSRQLSARLGYPLEAVLLSDLRGAAERLDIVATTLFHVEEVQAALPRHEVVGLMAAPDFHTLDEVGHLPPGSRIALVCATQEGVQSKARSIRAVGISRARILTATLQHAARLRQVLRAADVVLASPKVLERIAAQIPSRARVIPFASVLGEGAVALLAERIRAWRGRPPQRTAGARRDDARRGSRS
ncbi:MAG: GntR family transcriptional regulator [Armatimonadota bacterium]|nr:GntR family transcriptional regulator [Armatimonadota bacterium]MDR7451703.1 GntR family transcriptional regulator [Armatimonadota bacterium]MDR7465679.1 GntR family transcriptional regulator [Armatimonadota bacterium]MDR7493588.1 GntR family transcriptional regulator [Armatimonadota bacterium]MDR7499508.1 GntR family transcriptional regulator [Armatimonadota bacterium]